GRVGDALAEQPLLQLEQVERLNVGEASLAELGQHAAPECGLVLAQHGGLVDLAAAVADLAGAGAFEEVIDGLVKRRLCRRAELLEPHGSSRIRAPVLRCAERAFAAERLADLLAVPLRPDPRLVGRLAVATRASATGARPTVPCGDSRGGCHRSLPSVLLLRVSTGAHSGAQRVSRARDDIQKAPTSGAFLER